MTTNNSGTPSQLFPAIILAAVLHAVILSAVAYVYPHKVEPKTIPIKLAYFQPSSQNHPKTQNQPKQSTTSNNDQQLITTSSKSISSSSPEKNNARKNPISQLASPDLNPQITLNLPQRPSTIASRENSGILSLFRDIKPTTNRHAQVSTKSLVKLTEYEQSILLHLINNPLISPDQYYEKVKDTLTIPPKLKLEITLQKNGVIKSVRISKPSHDPLFNKMWKANAINASPYPAPPKEDQSIGFTYTIPIEFEENSN